MKMNQTFVLIISVAIATALFSWGLWNLLDVATVMYAKGKLEIQALIYICAILLSFVYLMILGKQNRIFGAIK